MPRSPELVVIAALVAGVVLAVASFAILSNWPQPPAPLVLTASAVRWEAERPWYPNDSGAFHVGAVVTASYADPAIRANLSFTVVDYWPAQSLAGGDELRILLNLSTLHQQGAGTGTRLFLTTDLGFVTLDNNDLANVTSTRSESGRDLTVVFRSTTIASGAVTLWWHLGGTPDSRPLLQGSVDVGYASSRQPFLVRFPLAMALRADSSPGAPFIAILPFETTGFFGQGDPSDAFRFYTDGPGVLDVNVSGFELLNASLNVTLVGPGGVAAGTSCRVDPMSAVGCDLTYTATGTDGYTVVVESAYPTFYRIAIAELS